MMNLAVTLRPHFLSPSHFPSEKIENMCHRTPGPTKDQRDHSAQAIKKNMHPWHPKLNILFGILWIKTLHFKGNNQCITRGHGGLPKVQRGGWENKLEFDGFSTWCGAYRPLPKSWQVPPLVSFQQVYVTPKKSCRVCKSSAVYSLYFEIRGEWVTTVSVS